MSETKNAAENAVQKVVNEEPQATGNGIFGIGAETKASNNVPIPPVTQGTPTSVYPTGYIFPMSKLVNVISNPEFEKKDLSKVAILQFVFRDKDGRQFIHTEWPVESNDAKFKEKIEGMNVRIKHLYLVTFGTFPAQGIGKTASSFGEFFNIVADEFNSKTYVPKGSPEGTKPKKLYSAYDFFLKLVYYKDRLGFPLGPNFIERVNPQAITCKQLTINPRYDHITPNGGSSSSGGGIPGMPSTDELPDFDKSFEDFE